MRFSLRLLFVVVALLAIALNRFVARPTMLANRFVNAVGKRDFDTARSMLPDLWIFNARPDARQFYLVYAEVLPRECADLFACERRIIICIGRHNDNRGQHVEWTENTDIVARPQGLEIETPVTVKFQWPNEVPGNQPAVINPKENIYLERNPRTG